MQPIASNRILIIDDNPQIHADFRKILMPAGASTTALDELERQVLGTVTAAPASLNLDLAYASQGEEGYQLFARAKEEGRPFFVAFVDMRMPPGWDGLRTIQEIRKIDSDATIVICTAYADHSWDHITAQIKSLDKILILKKPFDPVEAQAMAVSLQERWDLLQQSRIQTAELEKLVALRTSELEIERSKDKLRMEELEGIVAARTVELRKQALNDRLTGLPNRLQFYDHLLAAIAASQQNPRHQYAVMFIDFDRFKVFNDSLGHVFGDALLCAISERLQKIVGAPNYLARSSSPMALAARLGGDEFCILMQGFEDESVVLETAQKVLSGLSRPYELSGHHVTSTASVGVTFSRFGYRNAEDILRDADTAMYAAKAQGRGVFTVFDQSMHERAMRQLVLENDLRHAIDRGELSVWYQPIVELETRTPIAAEALLRWRHPGLGMISPVDFIPLAEETGLINPIGNWVFEQVCRQLHDAPGLQYISFNVSPRQIARTDFFDAFAATIARTGVQPSRLVAEITETLLTCDPIKAEASIQTLRQAGLRVFLDDFGAGHSALGSLRQFTLDGIKLDRSFLDEHVFTRRTASVIHSVITLARDLDIAMVAEGLESLEQVAMMQALSCDTAQGYLFSKPVPAGELTELLEMMNPGHASAA